MSELPSAGVEIQSQSLLTTEQAARLLALSRRTLEKWRLTGGGPQYRKIGARAVRYARADLDAFSEADVRASTSDTQSKSGTAFVPSETEPHNGSAP